MYEAWRPITRAAEWTTAQTGAVLHRSPCRTTTLESLGMGYVAWRYGASRGHYTQFRAKMGESRRAVVA